VTARWRAAVVGALLLGLAPLVPSRAATPDRDASVRALLGARDAAIVSGDRDAFLATVDTGATDAFRAAQGRLFDGLRTVALTNYHSELRTDEAPDLSSGLLAKYRTDAVFLPQVDIHYRLRDVDPTDEVDTVWYTFVLRAGKWRIISDTDVEDIGLQTARNPWDFGAVARKDTAHFAILFDPRDTKRATTILATAEEAYGRLVATIGRTPPAHIPIVLPHDLDQLAQMIQATFDVSNFVAFASANTERDDGFGFTAPRVYIQDTNLRAYEHDFQLKTLHHELVHVTAFEGLAGPFDPSWVHEGTADWISQGKFASKAVPGSDGVLPEDYEFLTGGQTAIIRSYDESDSAIAFLAQKDGGTAPMTLLETIGKHRVEAGTERYWVDQGLRAIYGAGFTDFQTAWAHR